MARLEELTVGSIISIRFDSSYSEIPIGALLSMVLRLRLDRYTQAEPGIDSCGFLVVYMYKKAFAMGLAAGKQARIEIPC